MTNLGPAIAQMDYAAGMFRSVARHLVPDNGAYDISNALLDDDGSITKRGGSAYLSGAGFGATGLRFIWDGELAPGPRTVVANPDDFGVLAADDSTIVNIGGAGLTAPKRAVEIGGVLVIGGGAIYAGSRKTADYSTGTVSVTNGSAVVTGSGTTWNTLVEPGMLLRIGGAGRYYVVKSIDSITQLTLTETYEGATASAQAYVLSQLGTAPKTADVYLVVGDKLLACSGNRIDVSRGRTAAGQLQWQTFDSTDYHLLPQGVRITGGATLGDTAVLFTTAGVWTIGNLALDLTDDVGNAQHPVSRISADTILWGNEGVASSGSAIVAPTVDGVVLVTGAEASPGAQMIPVGLSIKSLVSEHVRSGYRPGLAAVYRNHYYLPVLNATNDVVSLLVCRLDRPVRTRLGVTYPWTRIAGSGGNVAALAVRVASGAPNPKLLAAGRQATSRVLDLSAFHQPSAAAKQDHDATNFEWDWTTRDYPIGRLNVANFVKSLRVRYELFDAASDNPAISAYYSVGVVQSGLALWGTAVWGTDKWADSTSATDVALAGLAPVDDGRTPYTWRVNKKARFIRFRLRSSSPTSKLVLRTLELFVRPSAKTS